LFIGRVHDVHRYVLLLLPLLLLLIMCRITSAAITVQWRR
jgi:hypothetical protein